MIILSNPAKVINCFAMYIMIVNSPPPVTREIHKGVALFLLFSEDFLFFGFCAFRFTHKRISIGTQFKIHVLGTKPKLPILHCTATTDEEHSTGLHNMA